MSNFPKKNENFERKSPSSWSGRIPPQSGDLEDALVGCLMMDKEALLKVVDFLRPEHFYKDKNGLIYECILDLFNKKEPIDLITLTHKLETLGHLVSIGGEVYLAYLLEKAESPVNVEYYAMEVKKTATLRRLISVGSEVMELGFEQNQDVEEVLDRSEKLIFGITQSSVKQDYVSLKTALETAFDRIDEVSRDGGGLRGLRTGFKVIDNATGGLQPANLIILAARPSVGKTSFALDIAKNVAKLTKKGVVFFSLEMSKDEVVDRLICAEARVNLWKMRTGKLANEDFSSIAHAMDVLSNTDFYIDDTPGNSVMKMRAVLRRVLSEIDQLGLVVIDYLQLMTSAVKNDNVVQQVSDISRSLKSLAREFDVPVIALSQLNRSVESRSPQIPRLSDLRESGSIEQDADLVMFIYREERENPDTERKGIAEIHIAKQRNGPVGKVDLGFQQEFASFVNLEVSINK
jgi:replicative DNA helicase